MDKVFVKNIVINFAGLIIPAFVSLATVPAYIHALGLERYGVVALVWILIDYFGILGFTMSVAAQNRISKAHSAGDSRASVEVLWSVVWANLMIGVLVGAAVYASGLFYVSCCMSIESGLRHEVTMGLPWLALAVPVANVTCAFGAALTGVERFGVFNTTQTLGTVLFQLVPLGVAFVIGPTFQNVLAAAILMRLLTAARLAWQSSRMLGVSRVMGPRREVVKSLFDFGGWMFVGTVTSMVSESIDRVLIASTLGARLVALYSVPKNLVTRLNILAFAVERVLFPRLSAVDSASAATLMQESSQFLASVLTPIVLAAMLAVGPFLHVWVGNEVASVATPFARILIITMWIAGQADVVRILVQSHVSVGKAARTSMLQLPVYVAVLWIAIQQFGLMGAAVANVFRVSLDYVILLKLSRTSFRLALRSMFAHVVLLLVCLWLISAFDITLMTYVAGAVLILADMAWSLAMSPALRNMGRSLLLRLYF
ncbi:lipopolysaccharide biosynthesis related membrane protein [Caballeronia temeraria]|uniref:Lipopolysaccharide biosynthesis related membrane protein n=1 Tax=Caballeronia temeraria TaxID=1777137 RepID=A0A157ZVH0_9BURK|nr:oligosaccharide flippase family protein [Caballeronia temeraria]SAK49532.1 lipopolysaccharide biosynthesis related membrane protein [Caballeronia temeraria]